MAAQKHGHGRVNSVGQGAPLFILDGGCDMGIAADREGWRDSPQPRAGYSVARGMPCMEDVGLTYTPLPMFSAQARHVTDRISAGGLWM